MEEIERFEVNSPTTKSNGCAYILDIKTDNILNTYDSCNLLNQQDKRIRELEEENTYFRKEMLRDGETFTLSQAKVIDEIRKENQQLKQQLKEYSELGTPKEIDDTYRSRNILTNDLQEANRIIDDLVKQLHDLPKKIVEDITNELSNNTSLYFEMRESTSAHCPNKEYEWFNYVRFRDYINAILQKYGGGNE